MKLPLAVGLGILLVVNAFAQDPPADKRQLDACANEYLATKQVLAKHPKDIGARKRFVRAGDRYATAAMTSNALPPKVKYPMALRLYREVLKVDPHNREAASNAGLIESIYRSMKRPIPK